MNPSAPPRPHAASPRFQRDSRAGVSQGLACFRGERPKIVEGLLGSRGSRPIASIASIASVSVGVPGSLEGFPRNPARLRAIAPASNQSSTILRDSFSNPTRPPRAAPPRPRIESPRSPERPPNPAVAARTPRCQGGGSTFFPDVFSSDVAFCGLVLSEVLGFSFFGFLQVL